jgi:2,4-diaminopentanoate dehydrogenase
MIKVAVWGTGMMGQGLLGFLLDRPGDAELVGAIVTNPAKEGVSIGELLGRECDAAGRPCDLKMTADHESVLARKPDVVCVCTQSYLHEITDQVEPCVRAGANVISIAERLAYPWASDPTWAECFDKLAKERGVSILGTGVNPGFVLDALVVMWTSVCLRVDRIEASRVNDLSPFGPTVMRTQGVGTTVEEFERGVSAGTIVGHIGFQESISLIAHAVGWTIDEIVETREPIITSVERSTPHVHVAPGDVCGCRHIGRGYSHGELKIELVHPQQIHPGLEGVETGDYIRIIGDPDVNMVNAPEIPGGKGTYASTGNYIPVIGAARPGMLTVVDMPLPRFWSPSNRGGHDG